MTMFFYWWETIGLPLRNCVIYRYYVILGREINFFCILDNLTNIIKLYSYYDWTD